MDQARARMVREQIASRGLTDPELLRAFGAVPRHLFVDSEFAYADEALPLPAGQTISQPYIVALMTDAARPAAGWRGARVLEIGTGSGYQAAILAELGASVVSIERHAELSAARWAVAWRTRATTACSWWSATGRAAGRPARHTTR